MYKCLLEIEAAVRLVKLFIWDSQLASSNVEIVSLIGHILCVYMYVYKCLLEIEAAVRLVKLFIWDSQLASSNVEIVSIIGHILCVYKCLTHTQVEEDRAGLAVARHCLWLDR